MRSVARRRVGRALLVLLLALLALPVALLLGLQTAPGRAALAALVERAVTAPGLSLELEGVASGLPGHLRVARIAIGDSAGTWLALEGLDATVRWQELLQGRLVLGRVTASRVDLPRLPVRTGPAPPAAPFAWPTIPALPSSLPPIAIDSLAIDRLDLGAGLLGEAVTVSVRGRGGVEAGGHSVRLHLDLSRLDGGRAALRADASADLATRAFSLALHADEGSGLVARLLGRPEVSEATLDLDLAGPLGAWHGDLDAMLGGLASVHATLEGTLDGPPRLALAVTVEGAERLPAPLGPLIGASAQAVLRAGASGPSTLAIDSLAVTTALGRLESHGTIDLGRETADLALAATVPDLTVLRPLTGVEIAGAAGADVAVRGPWSRPEVRASLSLRRLGTGDIAMAEGTVDVVLTPGDDRGQGALPEARLEGSLRLTGLSRAGAGLGGGPATATVQAVRAPGGALTLDRLTAEVAGVVLNGRGKLDEGGAHGSVEAELTAASLATTAEALSELVPGVPSLAGAMKAKLAADLDLPGRAAVGEVTLAALDLAGLPEALAPLIGAAPRAGARFELEAGRRLALTSVEVDAAGLRGSGRGWAMLPAGALDGALTLDMPDLGVLSTALGRPAGGRAHASLTGSGTLDAPDLALALTLDRPRSGTMQVERVTLDARSSGPPDRFAGDLRLAVVDPRAPATARARIARDGGRIRLDEIAASGPGLSAKGNVAFDATRGEAEGRVDLAASDLAPLGALLGQDLAGGVDLAATLTTRAGRPSLQASGKAAGLRAAGTAARGATLQARVDDVIERPNGTATLTVTGLASGPTAIDRSTLELSGSLDRLRVVAAAAGRQGSDPLSLDMAATAALAGPKRTLAIERLSGTAGGQALASRGTVTATLGPEGAASLDGLDLAWGRARLAGRARLSRGSVEADLTADVPTLAPFARMGGPALEGRGTAQLTARGPVAAPSVTLDMAARGLKPAGQARFDMEPLDLTLHAELARRRLTGEATLANLTREPVKAQLAAPVALSLQPFSLAVDRDGPLSGALTGRASLARVGRILALDGQRLDGVLDVDLAVAGSLASPQARGTASIRDGLVEDATTGAMIRDLELDLVGDRERLVLSRLAGRDRRQGRLSGSGEVRLARTEAGGVSLAGSRADLSVRGFEVLRSDLGTASLTGDLALVGTEAQAALQGTIGVDRADLQIPGAVEGTPPRLAVTVKGEPPAPLADDARPLPPVALAIAIEAPQRIFVRGRGLESEWGGSLRVGGTVDAPAVTGELTTRRGFFALLDRRFTVDRGRITFDGRLPPVPTIDVEARAQGDALTAIVTARGPADALTVALSSDPTFPQDEIVSRLLFDRATAQITPAQGLRVAAAVQELRGGAGSGLLGKAREALGVDSLGAGASGDGVAVGKYLSDDVYLEVQQGLTPESSKARVEVQIRPGLSASSDVGREGQAGVQLEWRRDY